MNVIISSAKGIHIDEIEKGLVDGTLLGRVITILDKMPLSDRNLTADIELAEMFTLRANQKILQVERLHEVAVRTKPVKDAIQPLNPVLQDVVNSTHDNWGLDYCTEDNGNYLYSHDGEGIDIVIMDSGIAEAHTEFKDSEGISRIQQIEWKANQNVDKPLHYTDQDGHGTHTSGTAAGLTQGWARNAKIYSIKIFDTDSYSNPLEAFQLVKAWHLAKTGEDANRPTVMNNSWGYESTFPVNYPDVLMRERPHPVRYAAIDAEVESLIEAGIIVVASSGNSSAYLANPGDPEYYDYYFTDENFNWVATVEEATYQYFYKRKSPAGADGVICVGSVGNDFPVDKNKLSWYSNYGPRVDIFAPGLYIQSASNDLTSPGILRKSSGTSMSCPQVVGIIAIYASMLPAATTAQIKDLLASYGKHDVVTGNLFGAVNLSIRSIVNWVYIKDGGVWKNLFPSIKQTNAWKAIKEVYAKTAGTNYKFFG